MAGYPALGREQMYTNVTGLNAIPSEYDIALQHRRHQHPHQQQHGPGYDFQSDLDMFTNTQFFDLDMGEVPETNSPSSHDGEHWPAAGAYIGDRPVSSFNNYPAGAAPPYAGYSAGSSSATTPSGADRLKSIDGELKTSPGGGPLGLEEASRMAAEEDKRRRNTAASARFRVKKKQREQALEKTAKDMTDRVTYLENRVATLEMENKFLKDLITEKSGPGAGLDLDLLKKRAES